MIITLIGVGLIVLGFVFLLIDGQSDSYNDGWMMTAVIMFIIGGTILLSSLIAIGGKEMCANAYVVKYEAVQQTMNDARANQSISQFELAALQQKAVEKNEALASMKYWATHPLCNWFYSRKILRIEPIK